MAFVHGSVNEMSKQYLTNERRYNYTTPKSFLELVYFLFICCTRVQDIIYSLDCLVSKFVVEEAR